MVYLIIKFFGIVMAFSVTSYNLVDCEKYLEVFTVSENVIEVELTCQYRSIVPIVGTFTPRQISEIESWVVTQL